MPLAEDGKLERDADDRITALVAEHIRGWSERALPQSPGGAPPAQR